MTHALKRLRNQKGFTLVELLVVIAILAVLAAIVIPRVVNNIGTARATADASNRTMLQSAAERFFIDHNSAFPIATGGDATAGTGDIDYAALTGGNYIATAPADPYGRGRAYTMTAGVVNILGP